jgi:hypothetical protein
MATTPPGGHERAPAVRQPPAPMEMDGWVDSGGPVKGSHLQPRRRVGHRKRGICGIYSV